MSNRDENYCPKCGVPGADHTDINDCADALIAYHAPETPYGISYSGVVDKTGWGDGPWNEEPDKLQWIDEATALDCLIVRGPVGALCGYVGVPPEHPWHGHSYTTYGIDGETVNPEAEIAVHGGLTYAGACQEGPEDRSICHVPARGRPDNVWWFGFDTAHISDLAPTVAALDISLGLPPLPSPWAKTYKTVDYVRKECAELARQLAEVS